VVLAHGCKISCDEILSKENLSKHNAIFLPGGPGYKMFNEKDTPKLVAFVKKFANDKKTTFMSICAATKCYAD
jgi:putative intracellular protease/amidase